MMAGLATLKRCHKWLAYLFLSILVGTEEFADKSSKHSDQPKEVKKRALRSIQRLNPGAIQFNFPQTVIKNFSATIWVGVAGRVDR